MSRAAQEVQRQIEAMKKATPSKAKTTRTRMDSENNGVHMDADEMTSTPQQAAVEQTATPEDPALDTPKEEAPEMAKTTKPAKAKKTAAPKAAKAPKAPKAPKAKTEKKAAAPKAENPKKWTAETLPKADQLKLVSVSGGAKNQYINLQFTEGTIRLYPIGFGTKANATKARDLMVAFFEKHLS